MTATIPTVWSAQLQDHIISLDTSFAESLVAAAESSGHLAVLDLRSGQILWRTDGHRFGVCQLAFSPDGRLLASCGQDGKVCIWESRLGRLLAAHVMDANWVEHLAWSPSGETVLASAGKHLCLLTNEGAVRLSYPSHPATIADIAWQPGRNRFATVTYGFVSLWTGDSNKPQRQLPWPGSMLKLAWQPQGRYLVTGNQDASLQFWILDQSKDLQMSGYDTKVRELSWDNSGRYLASGGGKVVVVWDCSGKGPKGRKPLLLSWHIEAINALRFAPSGLCLASGAADGLIALWSIQKKESLLAAAETGSAVSEVAWAGSDCLLVGTAEGRVLSLLALQNP